MEEKKTLRFHGGGWMSFLPFGVFIIIAIYISVLNAPDIRGMWVGALLGIMATYFFATDKQTYCDTVIEGMADPIAVTPIACWIFAGVFASVLRASGLVEGIIWLAYNVGASGRVFVAITFIASALFATAAGTGFGTIVAGMSVLYPAGVLLGANPVVMAGAIVGGGAFGDNLAPLSDTTICSAATQGADVGGVVKSRLKYSLVAGAATLVAIMLFGGGGTAQDIPYDLVSQYMNPKGLLMLIPAAITITLAIKGHHIIAATTIGSIAAAIFGCGLGMISPSDLLFIKEGTVQGLLVDGIGGMVDICILALLVLACVRIMQKGGGDQALIGITEKFVHTARGVEMSIGGLALAMSGIMGLNAPPILAIGTSFAKPLGEKYKISPYRRANLLDATACTLVYSLPWTPALLLTKNLSVQASEQFGSMVPALTTTQMSPWILYCWALLVVMLFAMISGWGRMYVNSKGEEVKTLAEAEA